MKKRIPKNDWWEQIAPDDGKTKHLEVTKLVRINTGIELEHEVHGSDYSIGKKGQVRPDIGWRWNGASGPTFDTPGTFRPSAGHDAFYDAIEEGLLPMSYRRKADKFMRAEMRALGISKFRAGYWYYFVRVFGRRHAK